MPQTNTSAGHNKDNEAILAAQVEGEQEDTGPAKDAGNGAEHEAGQAREKRFNFQIVESKLKREEIAAQLRESEPTLLGRAKALCCGDSGKSLFEFKKEQKKSALGFAIDVVVNSAENRVVFFETMFGNGPDRPHLDDFRGRFVDHVEALVDERYSMIPMIQAMAAAGLEKQEIDPVRKTFKEWIMMVRRNDLIDRVTGLIPEWDNVSRLEDALLSIFGCDATDLTKEFGKYFWLSLYGRIMHPGCLAPIVLSIFGAQNAGKSWFSNLLCKIITGRKDAESVQLDLGGDKLEFLREITGNAVIANIGEMTGFNKAELTKVKTFITKTSDNLHYKYEGNFDQPRQWIAVLDGNEYEGLQRDPTGNRRFYPIFAGQLPDKDGKPHWKADFRSWITDPDEYKRFEEMLWQIMAECRAWFAENGMKGYVRTVQATIKGVEAFNKREKNLDRGTSKSYELDTWFIPTMQKVIKKPRRETKGEKRAGVVVYRHMFEKVFERHTKKPLNYGHLEDKITAAGGEVGRYTDNQPGYFFPGYESVEAFNVKWKGNTGDAIEGEESGGDGAADVDGAAGNGF